MPEYSISSKKIQHVISDWKRVKKINDYELVVGKILFQNLFEKCPQAKPLFGFPMETDPRNKYLLKSPRFAQHATFLVKMVDTTVNMLGEGVTEHLTKMLTDLGKKHVAYGVMPEYFPFMTESLLVMLKETIGNVNDDAWQDVFDYLSSVMEAGHRRINKDVAAKMDKDICINVWKRLTFMRKYKEEGGVILFQNLFESCPEVKVLFGFPADIDPRCEELVKSKRFAFHATFLMEMMERTVEMLGDDNDKLTEALTDLGKKHVAFGVLPEYFPYMTEALIVMLKELLGDRFGDADQKAFENVLAVLIADMVKGQRKVDKGLAAANKSVVIQSWAKLTKLENYEERAGILLFQNVFEMCPPAKLLFGFPKHIDPRSDALLHNKRFLTHATFLLTMIHKTVNLLGVDNDELTKTLTELGKKHVTYGVKADYFPFMTKSVVIMMKEMLGDEFTDNDRKVWEDILSVLIADMVKGQRTLEKGLAAANKNIVSKKWGQLSEIADYDEVGGLVIFENLFVTCPEAKPLFGFSMNVPLAEIRESKRLLIHASFIVEMIEKALEMLGGDDKELTDFMTDLGRKHIAYGVKPEYMPRMQQSIVLMLKSMLTEKNGFTEKDEKAWQAVLSALVADMTRAQREVEMQTIADAMII